MAARPPNALYEVIARAAKLTDAVIVGFSCGVDSLALLDLCAAHFRRIEPYYLYVTPGLSFHQSTIRRAEKRYGVKVHQLPHPKLATYLHDGIFRVPNAKTRDVPLLKATDIEDAMRMRTGLEWIATGQKRSDSLERCAMLSKCNNLDAKTKRIFPLAWWRDPFVWRYLKDRRIPPSAEYSVLGYSFGGGLSATDLVRLRQRFPEDYQRIIERFPFASGEVFRHETFGEEGRHIPAVTTARYLERAGSATAAEPVPGQPQANRSPQGDVVPPG